MILFAIVLTHVISFGGMAAFPVRRNRNSRAARVAGERLRAPIANGRRGRLQITPQEKLLADREINSNKRLLRRWQQSRFRQRRRAGRGPIASAFAYAVRRTNENRP